MTMLNNVVHKNILVQILKDIYTDTSISPFLGFKGGTAVYIFYQLDRFSIDLDFDLLDESKKYGTTKDARVKRFSLFFLLSYEDNTHNIKVEINLRKFGSRYELKTYLGISMLVMVRQDIFSHKLVAMFERLGKANRDIYDVHFFLKNRWPINNKIIENRTKLPSPDFVKKCIAGLEKTSNRNILNETSFET